MCSFWSVAARAFRVEFFFFAAIGDFARARGGGGVKKGTKRKKGDEFTYIEVFKRLIASGDAMTR